MLDKRSEKYFDYLLKLQIDRFTGKLGLNFEVKQGRRVKI